jgi:hypothetical protein
MMTNDTPDEGSAYVIPARTLRGSKRDMVAEIDEAIIGLLALRQLIDGDAALPEAPAVWRRRPQPPRRWPHLLSVLRPFTLVR